MHKIHGRQSSESPMSAEDGSANHTALSEEISTLLWKSMLDTLALAKFLPIQTEEQLRQ